MAHGPRRRWAPHGKNRIHKRIECTHGVFARLMRHAGDINLDGVNVPQVNAEFEVAIDALDNAAQVRGYRGEGQSGHMHGAHLGKVDLSFAAHAQVGAEVDLAPDADAQFIVWADDQLAWRRPVVDRAKQGLLRIEEPGSVNRQHLSAGGGYKLLKFIRRFRSDGARLKPPLPIANHAFRVACAARQAFPGRGLVGAVCAGRIVLRALFNTQCRRRIDRFLRNGLLSRAAQGVGIASVRAERLRMERGEAASNGHRNREQAGPGARKATAGVFLDSHDPQLFAYPLRGHGENAGAMRCLVPNVDISMRNFPYRMWSAFPRIFPLRIFS